MSKFDVQLPPFEINETVQVRGLSRPVSWGIEYMKIPEAWPITKGRGVVAFVIDTEDSTTHPDVKEKVIPAYSKRFTNEGPEIVGEGGHGLHVSDTVLQVAPDAVVGMLKALTNEGSGYYTWIADAIRFAADVELLREHAGFKRVINMSLGSDFDNPTLKSAIGYAREKGVEVVCAAGNDGRDVDFPGANPEVIGVAAIDSNGRPAGFSSPGPEVDMAGPGVNIWAAWKDGYASLNGTSMAAPHIAGFVALLLSYGVRGIYSYLTDFATDVNEPGFDEKTGYGVPVADKYFIGDPEPEPEPDPTPPAATWWQWVIVAAVVITVIILIVLS